LYEVDKSLGAVIADFFKSFVLEEDVIWLIEKNFQGETREIYTNFFTFKKLLQ